MFISLNPDAVGLGNAEFRSLLKPAHECGFDGIDFPVQGVNNTLEAKSLARQVADAGLKWGLFTLPCDFLRVDEAQYRAGIARLKEILPVVEAAGCRRTYNHIWPGSNEREWDENFSWHVARLQELHGLLASSGVRLGVEFIGPITLQRTFRFPFIRRIQETVSLIDTVDRDLGVVLDCFHWYTSGGTLDELAGALAGLHIVNVHANDAKAGRAPDEQMDLERQLPLETGLIDAVGLLRLLDQFGYDGPVIAEPFNPQRARYSGMPAHSVLAEVGKSMRALFSAADLPDPDSPIGRSSPPD